MSFYPPADRLRLSRLATGAALAAIIFLSLITAGVLPGGLH